MNYETLYYAIIERSVVDVCRVSLSAFMPQ